MLKKGVGSLMALSHTGFEKWRNYSKLKRRKIVVFCRKYNFLRPVRYLPVLVKKISDWGKQKYFLYKSTFCTKVLSVKFKEITSLTPKMPTLRGGYASFVLFNMNTPLLEFRKQMTEKKVLMILVNYNIFTGLQFYFPATVFHASSS